MSSSNRKKPKYTKSDLYRISGKESLVKKSIEDGTILIDEPNYINGILNINDESAEEFLKKYGPPEDFSYNNSYSASDIIKLTGCSFEDIKTAAKNNNFYSRKVKTNGSDIFYRYHKHGVNKWILNNFLL